MIDKNKKDTKAVSTRETRIDFLSLMEDYSNGSSKFLKDGNGFLEGKTVVTTTGVYPYIIEDGSLCWELRAPQDVYHPDSLATLKNLPLTNNHPKGLVTPDNYKDLAVGSLGSDIEANVVEGQILASVQINDEQTQADVHSGKRGLSCGYTADVVDEQGIWNGVPYTARQTNIRYNHVSVVEAGRAGDAAIIRMDGWKGVMKKCDKKEMQEHLDSNSKNLKDEGGNPSMRKYIMDSVEYELDEAIILKLQKDQVAITAFEDEVKSMKADTSTLSAKCDSLTEENSKLQEKVDNSIKTDAVEALVVKRVTIRDTAVKAKVEVTDGISDMDLQKLVILSVDAEAKLDGKDEVYVNAYFDAIATRIDAEAAVQDKKDKQVAGVSTTTATGEDKEDVYKTHADNLVNAWEAKK